MSETPVPGVWYVDENGDEFLYAPQFDGPCKWFWRDGEVLRIGEPTGVFNELDNPHPPTRTEWAVSWYGADDYDQSKETFGENEERARARHRAYLLSGKALQGGSPRRLMRRQVTETEWQEVTE